MERMREREDKGRKKRRKKGNKNNIEMQRYFCI
jgi:hypothetical protein